MPQIYRGCEPVALLACRWRLRKEKMHTAFLSAPLLCVPTRQNKKALSVLILSTDKAFFLTTDSSDAKKLSSPGLLIKQRLYFAGCQRPTVDSDIIQRPVKILRKRLNAGAKLQFSTRTFIHSTRR